MSSNDALPGVEPAVVPAIRVAALSKCYHIYDKPADRLKQFFLPRARKALGRADVNYYKEFWSLRDVAFEIKRGEVVGVVGRNGSGKSTLLQMICGTLTPTLGTIETEGRIAALLELGSGFNPEYTGRDNVFMNAAIIGLSRDEVERRFEEIVAFADIGEFIDQPVKTYSSGMAVRLAFAVAINVDPDILVVDEALSVGDELFQRKCFSRIERLRAKGATILFVSHSGGTVIELCDRAILLDHGELLATGTPKDVITHYQKLLYAPADKAEGIKEEIRRGHGSGSLRHERQETEKTEGYDLEVYDPEFRPKNTVVYESRGVRISSPVLRTLDGREVNGLVRGREYRYCYQVDVDRACAGVRFGMLIKSVSGMPLGGALSNASIHEGMSLSSGKQLSVEFRFKCLLNPGVYFMNAGVFGCVEEDELLLHRLADALVFRVLPVPSNTAQELFDFGCVAKVALNG